MQGGPLEHVIAAKAVAFKEDLEPSYKDYMERVKANAATLSDELEKGGLNHEIGNDAMPQDAVVIAFSYELEEVVAMKGCLVVQLDDDVALRRAEQDLVTQRVNLRGVGSLQGEKLYQ